MAERFSDRHGYAPPEKEIEIRHDAPEELRGAVLQIAYEVGFRPAQLRAEICQLLRKRPDPNNWSEYPNIAGEVEYLVDSCAWYEVYDIVEALYRAAGSLFLDGAGRSKPDAGFAEEINKYFRRAGIGWQLVNGRIEVRGSEPFEVALKAALTTLGESGRSTSRSELHEALVDLSRRPTPDLTGAIQHAMAALECVARDACGDPKATLGEILKRYPNIVPTPLNVAVEKAWGYASEMGRHIREGRSPTFEDAELIVSVAAAVSNYLGRKTVPLGGAISSAAVPSKPSWPS